MPVTILRDTGAYRSFILSAVLPLNEETSCNSYILVWGVKMSTVMVPQHKVYLHSSIVSGHVKVGMRPQLPISGVHFILGNDLAGGRVFSEPEVVEVPCVESITPVSASVPRKVFPACAITRAKAQQLGEVVDLSDSFICSPCENEMSCSVPASNTMELVLEEGKLTLNVDRETLINAQKNDCTLDVCLSTAVAAQDAAGKNVSFVFDKRVLTRKWEFCLPGGCASAISSTSPESGPRLPPGWAFGD